jgi:hypothetical protein
MSLLLVRTIHRLTAPSYANHVLSCQCLRDADVAHLSMPSSLFLDKDEIFPSLDMLFFYETSTMDPIETLFYLIGLPAWELTSQLDLPYQP